MANQNDDVPDRDDFVHMHIGKAASRVARANFVNGFINDIADQQDGTPGALIDQDAVDLDDSILALSGLTGAANKLPYFTSASAMALADFTDAGRALVAGATVEAQRATLGMAFASVAAASGATIDVTTKIISTDRYATTETGVKTRYIRTSLADILTGGYPATSYFRSVDRYMLDGSTDAVNGGYWLIVNLELRPEMFGVATDATTTTAMLQAAVDFHQFANRKLRLKGAYETNGPISALTTHATNGANIEFDGDVVINYTGTAREYFLYLGSDAAAKFYIGMSGGSLTINSNSLLQRGLSVSSASGTTTAAGECHIRGVRVNDIYAPEGAASGAAYAIDIAGPFARYTLEDLAVSGVSRHTSLDATGDCKGLRVTQVRVPVVVYGSSFKDVRNLVQDNDGAAVFGALESSLPVAKLATFKNCVFSGINGRSIKTQCEHTIVDNCVFDHAGQTTITSGIDVDAQYGSLEVRGGGLIVDTAPGASYIPFSIQTLYATNPLRSTIRDFKILTSVVLPRFISPAMGASSPQHDLLIENCEAVGTSALATTVFSRCVVEFSASQIKAAGKKLSVLVRNNLFQADKPVVGYTGHDGTDISAKIGVVVVDNTSPLALTSNSVVFRPVSGSDITKLTDYVFANNPGWHSHFATWDLNFATIRPGNDITVNLAGATVTSGPATLPASGVARVLIGSGETTWFAYKPRDIIIGNADRHFYSLTGTWVERNTRAIIEATATYDIPSLALGASSAIQTITVTGAALGDLARASLSIDAAGVEIFARVSAADTVKYFAHNLGGADPTDLASATVKIRVEK